MKVSKGSLTQFLRFALVGGINTLIDLGVLNLLIVIVAHPDTNYSLYKAISFLCATVNSFFLNKYFTFADTEKTNGKKAGVFVVVTLISFAVNVAVPTIVYGILRNASLSAPLAALSTLCNFVGYKYFVFKK